MFFRIYSSRLARALSAIRARRARAVENMFMRKLPRTRHIWKYRYHTKIFLLKKLNKSKQQHETMKLQNEEFMLRNT